MAHLRTLEDNCVDGLTQEIPWTQFVAEIKQEWLATAIAVSVCLSLIPKRSSELHTGSVATECECDLPLHRQCRHRSSGAPVSGTNHKPGIYNCVSLFRPLGGSSVPPNLCTALGYRCGRCA